MKKLVLWLVVLLAAGFGMGVEAAGRDFISGQVVSSDGHPEAGVWVIAETDIVQTPDPEVKDTYRKIVVTNGDGRFAIPELPDGTYTVWVRGYGLTDSSPIKVRSGEENVRIRVAHADSPQDAAEIYPANYWLSLYKLPPKDAFPGDGEYIGQIPPDDNYYTNNYWKEGMESQQHWLAMLKQECLLCHQLGGSGTQLPSREAFDMTFANHGRMNAAANHFGREAFLDSLEDWVQRIQAGEVPPQPPRPEGLERNFVLTQWEFGETSTYVHDIVSTDRNNPTVNANGEVYGGDIRNDLLYIIDPVENSWKALEMPAPSPHNPMMDSQGRVWSTTWLTDGSRPDFCPEDIGVPGTSGNSLTMYDPDTEEFTVIPICSGAHHLEFDEDGVLWLSGGMNYLGWFDPGKWDPNDPATIEQAHGWSRVEVDSDGDGAADTVLGGAFHYGINPSPDGTIWSAVPFFGDDVFIPGRIERYDPQTDTFEVYKPPYGHGPRGIAADSKGVVWTALAGSGHLAAFDRDKCDRTWGLGDQCPEGWSLWKLPGPNFKNLPQDAGNTDQHYYIWVDRHNASGLGKDAVLINGSNSDSLIWFDQETEEMRVIRVPYPIGFYTRLLDARIDDPDAGWKGRGIFSASNTGSNAFHVEGGRHVLTYFQFRPDPLAR